jgi:uncharacterized protein YjdB
MEVLMRALSCTGAALALIAGVVACESGSPANPLMAYERLAVLEKHAELGVGDQLQLTVSHSGGAVTWQSLNPNVATVSTGGVVFARAIGSSMVVAASNRSTDTAFVSVHAPVSKVAMIPDSLAVIVGQSAQLSVQAFDKSGALISSLSEKSGRWSSTAPGVVGVSSTGVVQALRLGTAQITFDLNGKSTTADVQVVTTPIASISVTPSPTATTKVGSPIQLTAIAKDADGNQLDNRPITWSSSDSTLLAVSSTGSVIPRSAGSATITATAEGKQAQTLVSANPIVVAAVAVALNAATLQVGQATQATVTPRDSAGNALTGLPVSWASANPSVATVSTTGMVTAVSLGTSAITATVSGVSGSATETVSTATVANVSVVLDSSSLMIGKTTQATATAWDISGNVLTGRTVTWSSSNPAVATVSATGLVTAVTSGTVSITGTIEGKSANATLVSMVPIVTSITVTTTTPSVGVGQSTQAVATVKDQLGGVMTAPVTWNSSAPTIATVTSDGLVTGVTVGSTTLTVTASGKSASAPMTVQTAPSSPAGGTHIALTIQRLDGATGPVLVSNGIPLPPGLLLPSGLANVRLFVGGVEQSIYIEALASRHVDGSVRSVLVQFNSNVSPSQPLTGELVIGQARATPALTKPTASRALPAAVALPSDPNYLVTTELVGPTITAAANRANGGVYSKYEDDFGTYADQHWQLAGSQWGEDYYDRAAIYYMQWQRTGNPEYWRRAGMLAYAYRHDYVEAGNYQVSFYWYMGEGVALHYLATGDSLSWFALGRMAQQFGGCIMRPDGNCSLALTGYMDVRGQARALQSVYLAWRFASPGDPTHEQFNWGAVLDSGTTQVLATQETDGGYKSQEFCYGIAPYQVALLNDQYIKQYRYYKADPRLVASVTKAVHWLWNTQWISSTSGFHYNSVNCPDNGMGTVVGGLEAAPDLTNMMVEGFAWAAKQTGSATDAANARTVFASGVNTAYLVSSKQFNQAYESSPLSLGLITP